MKSFGGGSGRVELWGSFHLFSGKGLVVEATPSSIASPSTNSGARSPRQASQTVQQSTAPYAIVGLNGTII